MFYFTPLSGFFSPFPRGTRSLSVTGEYLALRGGPREFTRNFSCTVLLRIQLARFNFRLRGFHSLWRVFQTLRLIDLCTVVLSYNPTQSCRVVWALSPSLAATKEIIIYFLFLQLLRCFNSLGLLVLVYGFNQPCIGLPHSETSGSLLASSSPKRIVGNHVLLRLPVPRYPP